MANLTGLLAVTGSVLFPYFIFKIKQISKTGILIASITGLLLGIFTFPEFTNHPQPESISGYTFHFIHFIGEKSHLTGIFLQIIFVFTGCSSLLLILQEGMKEIFFPGFILFFVLFAGFCFNALPSERHLLPLVVLGYLLILRSEDDIKLLRYWTGYNVIIGTIYFYYIMIVYKIG